jgi:hypothetical protein
MPKPKAILSNRLFVPKDATARFLTKKYTYELGDPDCPDLFQSWKEHDQWLSFSRGNIEKLITLFEPHYDIEDQRTLVPWNPNLAPRFLGIKKPGEDVRFPLRDYQQRVIQEWIEHSCGVIEAPPRSGKTVTACALACKLKQRTLVLAHQVDLLNQFEETFRQSTNVNDIEKVQGKKLVGVYYTPKDNYELMVLSTYQWFYTSPLGPKWLEENRDKFGLIIVDESHLCRTELYLGAVNSFTGMYRCGLTATPLDPRNQLDVIIADVLGPVTAKASEQAMSVDWSVVKTNHVVKSFAQWSTLINRLSKDVKRNELICDWIEKDIRDGYFVLVTTERIQHVKDLVAMLKTRGLTAGELYGATFDRDQFRKDCKIGMYQVVVAMNRIVQLGYNVPRWGSFHNTMPMTNSVNWYQRISRIRTPMEPAFEGDSYVKPQPKCRVYLDQGHGAIWAYYNTVKAENERNGFTHISDHL